MNPITHPIIQPRVPASRLIKKPKIHPIKAKIPGYNSHFKTNPKAKEILPVLTRIATQITTTTITPIFFHRYKHLANFPH